MSGASNPQLTSDAHQALGGDCNLVAIELGLVLAVGLEGCILLLAEELDDWVTAGDLAHDAVAVVLVRMVISRG